MMQNSDINRGNKKPILITGSHRSGTTWVGKVLTLSGEAGYIHEPFNFDYSSGICDVKWQYYYQHVTSGDKNEEIYYSALRKTLGFQYSMLPQIVYLLTSKTGSMRTFLGLSYATIIDSLQFWYYKCISRPRPLMKCPLAFFSADWLASKFDMDVVITVRNPIAFAGSLKNRGWFFDFRNFSEQSDIIDSIPKSMRESYGICEDAPRHNQSGYLALEHYLFCSS